MQPCGKVRNPDRPLTGCTTAAFGSRVLSRAHRRDVVGFPPRRIATTVGGDMNAVEMVGGLVAVVRRPTRCANAWIEALTPDDVDDSPALRVRECKACNLVTEFDSFVAVVVRDHHVDGQAVGMPF